MGNVIVQMLLGNFIGDYFFQPRKMAKGKSKKGLKGTLWCTLHCLIYTITMCIFLWNFHPLFFILIFLSHYPIDRYSLTEKWMKFINGGKIIDDNENQKFEIIFACIMYAVIDNTAHLFLVWQVVKYFN